MPQPKPDPVDFIVGLDLGQSQDPTAAAVVERRIVVPKLRGGPESHYAVRHLQRWPLMTGYPAIVKDVCELVATKPLVNPMLAVDQTGVGAAVVDFLRDASPRAQIHAVVITAGQAVSRDEKGVWHCAKKECVSVLQVLLGTRRLKVAPGPLRDVLVRELSEFKVKITINANETFEAWRSRDHDDLVLAVALACFLGEQLPPAGTMLPYCGGGGPMTARQRIEQMPHPARHGRPFGF